MNRRCLFDKTKSFYQKSVWDGLWEIGQAIGQHNDPRTDYVIWLRFGFPYATISAERGDRMPLDLDPVGMIFLGLFAALYALCFVRILRTLFAPVRSVRAEVVDKSVVERFSKYRADGKTRRYAVVFLAEGKKRSFYVSTFSYGGYRVGERGTLTYKGDRLIGFE